MPLQPIDGQVRLVDEGVALADIERPDLDVPRAVQQIRIEAGPGGVGLPLQRQSQKATRLAGEGQYLFRHRAKHTEGILRTLIVDEPHRNQVSQEGGIRGGQKAQPLRLNRADVPRQQFQLQHAGMREHAQRVHAQEFLVGRSGFLQGSGALAHTPELAQCVRIVRVDGQRPLEAVYRFGQPSLILPAHSHQGVPGGRIRID